MERHAFFQELAGQESPLAFKPEHEPRLDRLRRRLGELRGKRAFEPGCGAGPLTVRLAEWVGHTGRVLALDACPGMVERCRAAATSFAHVDVRHGKVEEAELERAAWDLVLCFRLFPHLDDAAEFLRRCRSWLAPGGALVVANLEGSAALNALHARMAGVEGDVMPSGFALRQQLTKAGWRVEEAIDEADEFFLRARPA